MIHDREDRDTLTERLSRDIEPRGRWKPVQEPPVQRQGNLLYSLGGTLASTAICFQSGYYSNLGEMEQAWSPVLLAGGFIGIACSLYASLKTLQSNNTAPQ